MKSINKQYESLNLELYNSYLIKKSYLARSRCEPWLLMNSTLSSETLGHEN
jgi:hypothetical protein